MQAEDGEDFYEILQVHPKASSEVIKRAYMTLMQRNHPDRGGDVDLAQRINRAYAVLMDTQKRAQYDRRQELLQLHAQRVRERAQKQREQKRAAKAAQAARLAQQRAAEPPEIRKLKGRYESPMLWGDSSLVADERGNRVVILDRKGEVKWTYGKKREERLSKPRLALFDTEGAVWIADTGQQRILKTNLRKEKLWEFSYQQESPQYRAQAQPVFLDVAQPERLILTDQGHRQVSEIGADGVMRWQFSGKLAFSLRKTPLIQAEHFLPVSAFALPHQHYLIADAGNGRIFVVNHKNKLQWLYPDKKNEPLPAINFAYRLQSGSTWITSDKIIEISEKGEVLWHYASLQDVDIKQAYPLADSSFVLDFSHLVKRGINQEIMKLDHNNKVRYRHYYSQHRFLSS